LRTQKMSGEIADRDFVVIAMGGGVGVAVIFRVRQGAMIARQTISLSVPKHSSFADILSEFLTRYYAEDGDVPDEILVQEKPSECADVVQTLAAIAKKPIEIKVPQKGEKFHTLLLAKNNAELIHGEMMLQKEQVHVPYGVLELERLLSLPVSPNHIEAFDISNYGGDTVVASMVQFIGGKANRQNYRHFKIKSFTGQDDFASMREIVSRRYKRLLDEQKPLPDLILIDGGKGQLSSAMSSLKELALDDKITVISIAKRVDEIFTPNNSESVNLPKDSAALKLLQRIRDEAHRFAIEFSRKSHRQKAIHLEISEIPGIGKKRSENILKEFGGLDEIGAATVEELSKRGKLPLKLAQALKDHLAKEDS
jgi:excinuclease ABC subunit C